MSYTPGHATAKILSRQVYCPCCDGKGYYEASHSTNGFDIDGSRRYKCENCEHGKINWLDYKKSFQDVFGPARFA